MPKQNLKEEIVDFEKSKPKRAANKKKYWKELYRKIFICFKNEKTEEALEIFKNLESNQLDLFYEYFIKRGNDPLNDYHEHIEEMLEDVLNSIGRVRKRLEKFDKNLDFPNLTLNEMEKELEALEMEELEKDLNSLKTVEKSTKKKVKRIIRLEKTVDKLEGVIVPKLEATIEKLEETVKTLETTVEEQGKVIKNQEAVMKDFSLEKSVNEAIRLHPNFQFLNNIVDLDELIQKAPPKIPMAKKWQAKNYEGTPEEKVTLYLQKHWTNYQIYYSYFKNDKLGGGFCTYLERNKLLHLIPSKKQLLIKLSLEEENEEDNSI